MWQAIGGAITNWLFVPGCAACDAVVPAGAPVCEACAPAITTNDRACPGCAEPIAGPVALTCARCRRHPLPLAGLTAPYVYGGQLAVALWRLKFRNRRDVARTLAPMLAPVLAAAATDCDRIVPVPLHWRRLAGRGYNQAALLARFAAAELDLPVDATSLRRRTSTRPQSGLDARARVANLAGAFAVPRRRRDRIAGRRIVLVDDVVTTGATMAAAARALLAAGADSVWGFAAARAEAG